MAHPTTAENLPEGRMASRQPSWNRHLGAAPVPGGTAPAQHRHQPQPSVALDMLLGQQPARPACGRWTALDGSCTTRPGRGCARAAGP